MQWLSPLPSEKAMQWLSPWEVGPGLMLGAVLLVLLFPDGKLPHRGWWAVVLMAVCGTALLTYCNYLWVTRPGPGDVVEELGTLGQAILLASCVASLIPVIVRLQSAEARERQQFKWFAYGAAVFLVALLLMDAALRIGGPWARFVVIVTGLSAFPVAVGIAILRYRLYDIDVIINRTLVYGLLTAILVSVYFGGVTATQALFQRLTDQQDLPQLVVVASTLVIAALFTPLRRGHPVVHRPPFLPQEVRREEDTRRLLGPVARRDGPERLERRPGRSGKGDYATRTRLAVVASGGVTERRAGRLVTPYSPKCVE
jgi:hypothetical protein